MKINIEDITSGKLDYRKPNIHEKPIRLVEPQKVLVRSNTETKDRVYYSESHFVILNKNSELTKKIIKPFDNTGYRSYTGVALNVFDNEQECIKFFHKQIDEINNVAEVWIIEQLKIKSDLIDKNVKLKLKYKL